MLSHDEVIRISDNNQLARADVYKIRATFGSMVKLDM